MIWEYTVIVKIVQEGGTFFCVYPVTNFGDAILNFHNFNHINTRQSRLLDDKGQINYDALTCLHHNIPSN